MKYNSTIRVVSDGSLTAVALTFDVREQDEVHVYFNDDQIETGFTVDRQSTPQRVLFDPPVPDGVTVTIRRYSDMRAIPHVFHLKGGVLGGAEFNSLNIDENFDHILRAAQDAMDSFRIVGINIEAEYNAKAYAEEAQRWAEKAAATTKFVITNDTPEIKFSGHGTTQSPLEATIDSVDVSKVDGLGTAATKDVTEGDADVTAGRLLKVGDIGSNKRYVALLDFNELPDLYPYSGPVPVLMTPGSQYNSPPSEDSYYVEQHISVHGGVTQIAIPYSAEHSGMWLRSLVQGEWSPWREIGSSGSDEIVSQEEAEEGTSTTPRKWTAQRVRQSYDAAWAESKEEFLSNSNIFRAGQGIWIEQGVENLLLATSDSPYTLIGFAVGMADPETAKAFYLGSDKDGNLITLSEDGNLQPHRVWTSYSLPVRTMREIERYTGDGITLAQDARAALELGPPAPPTGNIFLPGVGTSDGILIPGRNLNITVKDVCVINTWPEKHGTGEFASITVRSDSTSIRSVFLANSILNKSDFESEYTVTDTEALYLEGRYVDSGFMITFLTKYTVPST